jgi:hypothetical protein
MTITADSSVDGLRAVLQDEFSRACARFAEARIQQRHKDTPSARAAVAARGAEIDAVLDMYLAAGAAAA